MTLARKILIRLLYQATLKQIVAAYRGFLVNQELLIQAQITDIWVRNFTDMNILILRFKETVIFIWKKGKKKNTWDLGKKFPVINLSFA